MNETARAFLTAHGRDPRRAAPLSGDAGARRYWRLEDGPTPALLVAVPAAETLGPFLRLASLLAARGLSVPEVIAADAARGLALIEDFGDGLYARVLDETNGATLYEAAIDALAILHAIPPPADLPAWDAPAMTRAAAATFLEWWWPAAFGAPPDAAIVAEFAAALAAMLAPLAAGPRVLLHRDYIAANLFWLPERHGPRRVGMIDFQDAGLGHPAYDLVSLLEDARRDLSPELVARGIRRYLDHNRALDGEAFEAACAITAAQRQLRIAALWVRLDRRDGKPQYLAHGPRTWQLLERALAHPATAPLGAFLARHVPPEKRCNPAPRSVP